MIKLEGSVGYSVGMEDGVGLHGMIWWPGCLGRDAWI